MVNLVVRHNNNNSRNGSGNNHNHNQHSQYIRSIQPKGNYLRDKVLSGGRHIPPPKPANKDRIVPSPIRVPSYQEERRPVSPLTTTESLFGGRAKTDPEVEHFQSRSPTEATDRGGGMTPRVAPLHAHTSPKGMPSMDPNGELTCDYDHNVTPLYELLESSHWDQARLRCRTHPEEVQTWIVRRDQNSNTRWKLLPLHAAVIFQAPIPVIEGMLKEFPIAAGKRDDQGMLPLHLAFRHKQDETLLSLLLAQYPQGVMVKDRRDRLPIDHGKDNQFSGAIVQQYAEALVRSQSTGNHGGDYVANELKAQHESHIESLKAQYDDQVADLMLKHEEELQDLRLKMEQDQHVVRTQHAQEMDELRDLLAREASAGQRAQQLQTEKDNIEAALAQLQTENRRLKLQMSSRGGQYEELQAHLQKVLVDQKTLHTFCAQQQQDLEQAHQVREQLLRSLLKKDDGKDEIRSSREICQLSDNIRLRTEQILTKVVANTSTPATSPLATRTTHLPTTADVAVVEDFVDPSALRPLAEENAVEAWGTHADDDHGDDISAITDDHF